MILKKRTKSRKTLFVAILLAMIVIASLVAIYIVNPKRTSQDISNNDSGINYAPPTDEEKATGDKKKDEIVKEEANQPPTDAGKAKVQPVISSWGQDSTGADLEVNGFIPSIVENDGTCIITAVNGSQNVSKSKGALQNAQSTSCGQLVIPYGELGAGTWKVQLSYSSRTSSGSSDIISVEVK